MAGARRNPIRGQKTLVVTTMMLVAVLIALGVGSIAVVLTVRKSQARVEATTAVITGYLGVSAALGGVALPEADGGRTSTRASSAEIDQANERLQLAVETLLETEDRADSVTAPRVEALYEQYEVERLSTRQGSETRADTYLREMMQISERAVALRRGRNQEVRLYEQQLVSVLTWLIPAGVAVGTITSIVCWRVVLRSHKAAVQEARVSQRQASRDPLTGLCNRTSLAESLEEAIRERDQSAVVALDLDYFKEINDNHGHAKGDEVLLEVAYALEAEVRPRDVVARIGGDEFVVLLRDVHDPAAIAERLREAIALVALRTDTRVSVSIGVAELRGRTASEALRLADRALYRAKRAGRDAVFVA